MTYWPVAFLIFVGVLWLLANSIKNHSRVFLWAAGGGYGVAFLLGFAMSDPIDGLAIPLVVGIGGGTVLMLVAMAFYLFWKEVC